MADMFFPPELPKFEYDDDMFFPKELSQIDLPEPEQKEKGWMNRVAKAWMDRVSNDPLGNLYLRFMKTGIKAPDQSEIARLLRSS